MTINSKILLCLILLITQTRATGAGSTLRSLVDPRSQEQPEIVTVDYCDLIRNQAKYAGQVIRVKAVMLALWHNASLYDSGCKEESIEAVLDCKNDEDCSAIRKPLERDMDYIGDVGRVEAVFTGSLVLPEKTADSRSRARFMIKRVEQTKRISRDVPWPFDN